MLLDFLHLSRNRYVYLRSRASKVGMLHWTWWLLTLALQGKLHRALQPKLYATRNLCMHDFLKLHHNWDAYMVVQKERKSTFLTAYEQREKESRSFVCCTILISQLSLNVFVIWELSIQYNIQIFVSVNRFYVLTTQFLYWSGCAFCTLSLKCHSFKSRGQEISGLLTNIWILECFVEYKMNRISKIFWTRSLPHHQTHRRVF